MHKPIVFLTTPTSGTGSLWRIITALTRATHKPLKVVDTYANRNRMAEIADWRPSDPATVYLFNAPAVWPKDLDLRTVRLICNFRDPRDLCCNHYYWALQHHVRNKSDEAVAAHRRAVEKKGIDAFVLGVDKSDHYRPFADVLHKIDSDGGEDVCVLSYNQLCLSIDAMAERLAGFLGVVDAAHVARAIEPERVENLSANPRWIGQEWFGSDIAPGRHRRELKPETIAQLTRTYAGILGLLRALDQPQFRDLYD
ncbi:hypothetical protein DLJ53_32070 [Acuticoccus sediminis]|uniref:Sulfotransferase domain-containing protein n=1 Tax=Acuticoccus sediminis TaxID=2184697 RepID=A0A8B2NH44_9HYPH|nr:hypothetical protein [Acuticoccus sediminis]RAH96548.1 hypothetical protein DLJ53_32070 [Acuticoccus sediminis]